MRDDYGTERTKEKGERGKVETSLARQERYFL